MARLSWVSTGEPWEARLAAELRLWEPTKYHIGSQVKGQWSDCFRFVCGLADDLYRRPRLPLNQIPADWAMHRPESARAAMRTVMRRYNARTISGTCVEPGDVVITAPESEDETTGPGHAMIVGPTPQLWHCTPGPGVCPAGMDLWGMRFVSILRPPDKHLWT